MKTIAAFFAFLFLAVAAPAQLDPERVILTVNGEAIKAEEYYRRMEFLTGVGKIIGDGFIEFPPGLMTIEQLVVERLMKQLAAKKGITPTKAEVDQEIKDRLETNPTLLTDWDKTGLPRTALEEQIFLELLEFKLTTVGITITNQEVENFYNDPDNKPMFTTPASATIRIIAVATPEQVATVDRELAAGKSFGDVAKAHSRDVSAGTGGNLGTMAYATMPQVLADAVRGVAEGKHSGWILFAENRVKVFKEKEIKEEVIPLSNALRRSIRRRLMIDRGSIKNKVDDELNQLRAQSTVDVKQIMLAEAWKRLNSGHLKAMGSGG